MTGKHKLNSRGDFYTEKFIRIVDHYDDEGNSLFDKYIVNNFGTDYGKLREPFNSFYEDSKEAKYPRRKEYLRGFVSEKDWTSFMNMVIERREALSGTSDSNKVLLSIKFKKFLETNLYEFFSVFSIGMRINYALGPPRS